MTAGVEVPRDHPGAPADVPLERRVRRPNLDEMYVTNGDKVFKRKTKVKGEPLVCIANYCK